MAPSKKYKTFAAKRYSGRRKAVVKWKEALKRLKSNPTPAADTEIEANAEPTSEQSEDCVDYEDQEELQSEFSDQSDTEQNQPPSLMAATANEGTRSDEALAVADQQLKLLFPSDTEVDSLEHFMSEGENNPIDEGYEADIATFIQDLHLGEQILSSDDTSTDSTEAADMEDSAADKDRSTREMKKAHEYLR